MCTYERGVYDRLRLATNLQLRLCSCARNRHLAIQAGVTTATLSAICQLSPPRGSAPIPAEVCVLSRQLAALGAQSLSAGDAHLWLAAAGLARPPCGISDEWVNSPSGVRNSPLGVRNSPKPSPSGLGCSPSAGNGGLPLGAGSSPSGGGHSPSGVGIPPSGARAPLLSALAGALSHPETDGPSATFQLDGENSGLLGTGAKQWPFTHSYAVATWIYIESFEVSHRWVIFK
jgi:hypothetical protein